MAQLAVAVGGAAVGGSLFGRVGAQLGFIGGSLLGAWLFSPRTTVEGPRLDDLRVTSSTYGQPIPIGYGTSRIGGNLIWSTGLIEKKNKKKIGGKGGPSTTQITYTYSASFAIGFSNREAANLIRLWADSKLIYDLSLDADGDPKNAIEIQDVNFRFYKGTEGQGPDPTIESIEGVGNVPGYKGLVYIVFDDIDLANFGNRIPSVTAEISHTGTNEYPLSDITPTNADSSFPNQDAWIPDKLRNQAFLVYFHKMAKIDLISGNELATADVNIAGGTHTTTGGQSVTDENGNLYIQVGVQNNNPVYKLDSDSLAPIAAFGPPATPFNRTRAVPSSAFLLATTELQTPQLGNAVICGLGFGGGGLLAFSQDNFVLISGNEQNTLDIPEMAYLGRALWGTSTNLSASSSHTVSMLTIDRDGYIWAACNGVSNNLSFLYKVQIAASLTEGNETGIKPSEDTLLTNVLAVYDLSANLSSAYYVTYYQDEHAIIVGSTAGELLKFDIDSETVIDTLSGVNLAANNRGNFRLGVRDGEMVLGGNNFSRVDISSFTVEATYTAANWGATGNRRGVLYHALSNSMFAVQNVSGSTQQANRYWLDRVSGLGENLDVVVADICDRCGLESADVDVTELASDTVRGYPIGRQVTGRQALNPLVLAYFFDARETDWILEFIKRGRSGDFAIPEADLAANSGLRPSYNVKETLTQEIETPESVYVEFADVDNDYQPNESYYKRRADVVTSKKKQKIQLPLAFTATEAKEIATKWIYQLWNEQGNLEFETSQKWLAVDPGDVGTVTDGATAFSVRIVSNTFADYIFRHQAIEDLDAIYTLPDTFAGDGGSGVPDQSINVPGPTDLALLDIPLLRDNDATLRTQAPMYFGLKAFSDDWTGGVIFKSQDGTNFEELAFGSNEITWGTLQTKITASSNWSTWDRFRTFTVNIVRGSANLASATEEQVLNGANSCAIGDTTNGFEILQFADVTDNGDGTFTFQNLLRGRRGSELFQSHAVGELFVLLDINDIIKHNMGLGEIDATRYFRASTIGAIETNGRVHALPFKGYSLWPYSPTDIRGARDGSNNLTITWERRTRYGGDWRDLTGDVPLGEESEQYEVDIVDTAGMVLRTIEGIAEETTTYTAAEQTTDGLTPGDPVTVHVYQVSDIVGRGFKGIDTI